MVNGITTLDMKAKDIKAGFKTKREATEAESIARNKLMKGFIINNKTSFIDYYND